MLVDEKPHRVSGTLGGRTFEMGIKAHNMGKIMNMLSAPYEDPMLAVIREYSTNGDDSNRSAGSTKPLVVTLPTTLSPYLVIEDSGLGMSFDELADLYGSYGESTKTNDAEANGHLGIGSKAAFAYADAFSVRSIKDGKRCEVMLYRSDYGGTVEVVDETDTDEPNGVRVTVAVKMDDIAAFREKAERFFAVWDKSRVTLLGGDVKHIQDVGRKIADDTWVIPGVGRVYYVMGSVAYQNGLAADFGFNYGFDIYHFAPMNSISHTQSRESLKMDDKTVEYLANCSLKSFSVEDYLTAEIAKIRDPHEAFETVHRLKETFMGRYSNLRSAKYQGMSLAKRVNVVKSRYYDFNKATTYVLNEVSYSDSGPTLAYLDMGGKKFTAKFRAQLAAHLQGTRIGGILTQPLYVKGETAKRAYLIDAWLPILDYDTIAAIDVPDPVKGQSAAREKNPGYDYLDAGHKHHGHPTDATKIAYCHTSEVGYFRTAASDLGYVLVFMDENRMAKFRRLYPEAIGAGKVREMAIAKLRKPTDAEKRLAAVHHSTRTLANFLYAEGVRDRRITAIAKYDPTDWGVMSDQHRRYGEYLSAADSDTMTADLKVRFPMLGAVLDTYYSRNGDRLRSFGVVDYVKMIIEKEKTK